MKKILFAVAALVMGLTACNNNAPAAATEGEQAAVTTGKIAYFYAEYAAVFSLHATWNSQTSGTISIFHSSTLGISMIDKNSAK